jgi:hypothetical protein
MKRKAMVLDNPAVITGDLKHINSRPTSPKNKVW